MRRKKKEGEAFSMSFLDCICCGFGAVLLLFVLTASRRTETMEDLQSNIMEVIGEMDNDIALKDKELVDLKLTLAYESQRREDEGARLDETKRLHTELDERLKLLLMQLAAIEEELGKLIDSKKNMPTQEEKAPIPIPNPDRRQYLTDFDIMGQRVLFLIEASGSMTADKVEDAMVLVSKDARERSAAPKWKRINLGLRWMIANLREGARYKVVFFNTDVHPVSIEFGLDWFDPMDESQTEKVLAAIDDFAPEGGANFERAFRYANDMPIEPDRLVLICDGLPTLSDTYPSGTVVQYDERVAMLRAAVRAFTLSLPVNTILYPFMPDPGSAVHFWRLADRSGGVIIAPSENWPDL